MGAKGAIKPKPVPPELQPRVDELSAQYKQTATAAEQKRTEDTLALAAKDLSAAERLRQQNAINAACTNALHTAYKHYRQELKELGVATL